MNRNPEYEALLAELENTPEELKTVVQKTLSRDYRSQKKRRIFGIPAVSLAACFAGFVLLVNLFPPFARACGSVPVLRELAKAVAWSPSLSAAVENDYVQPVGQSQTVNGITATIQYIIVDQKQVNIFFTLEGDYDNLSAEMPEFTPDQHCSIMGADYRQPPGSLLQFTLDYMDGDVPEGFTMTFGATTYTEDMTHTEEPTEYSMLDEPQPEEPDILAQFTFDMTFDPDYTAKGELIPVNRTFPLDGQTVTVTEAEVYPTHVRMNVTGDPDNTAWLKSLDFCLENERGETFASITDGISATGDPEGSPAMLSYWLNSPYFSSSEHLTLRITGAKWLDKDRERVRIDLENGTADWLPEGVELYSAERRDNGWLVQFSVLEKEGHHFSPFGMTYYDAEGNQHEANGISMTTGSPYIEGPITEPLEESEGRLYVVLPLSGYDGGEVWLCPNYSHVTTETIPVAVPIK